MAVANDVVCCTYSRVNPNDLTSPDPRIWIFYENPNNHTDRSERIYEAWLLSSAITRDPSARRVCTRLLHITGLTPARK